MINLADAISLTRVVLSVPMHFWMLQQQDAWVFFCVCWMVLSDVLDGMMARLLGSSLQGVWLDPCADACAVMSWCLALIRLGRLSWMWCLFWAIRYVFFMMCAYWLWHKKRHVLASSYFNKISIVVLVCFLLQSWQAHPAWPVSLTLLGLQIWSMVDAGLKLRQTGRLSAS